MSDGHRYHKSEEWKRKMSEIHKGKKKNYQVWIKGKHYTETTKQKMSKARKGKHYPKLSEQRKGSGNPAWRGGITTGNRKIRNSLEYEIWRNEVYKRDYWTCRLCGHRRTHLVAHHLKLFSKYPELRFSIDNGITLCRECHNKIHKYKIK